MGPETEFKVGDRVRFFDTAPVYRVTAVGTHLLLAICADSPGCEVSLPKSRAVKVPETKKFEVTTEHRLPRRGEAYIDSSAVAVAPWVSWASSDFTSVSTHVITGVRPL